MTEPHTIILSGTYLEDMIRSMLELQMRQLNSEYRDAIFGVNAPLGTFSAKINMGYALNIYGPANPR